MIMIRCLGLMFIWILVGADSILSAFDEQDFRGVNGRDSISENSPTFVQAVSDIYAIQPWQNNPSYWQYKGEPVLLLGGSNEDNLFNHPDLQPDGLKAHMDLLVSAGGNYIRNTMSSRDEGNVWPFQQLNDGRYDLDRWNTEYWDRFDNLLRMTGKREIIVQIEIWDPWDMYVQEWTKSPWNPENNVNYSTETSKLAGEYDRPRYANDTSYGEPHDFFLSVPDLEHDHLILAYQTRFVEKILSYTFSYDHVLYTITNEIHPQYPPEWGWFWSRFIKKIAAENDQDVYVTEMYWQPDMKNSQHKASLEQPDIYDYFEASQNSATLDAKAHWDNLLYVGEQLARNPRPVNHTKMYGADTGFAWTGNTKNVAEKFWRNIFAGAASARFHRPPAGIGLSTPAQRNLRSMRMLSDSLNFFKSVTLQDLISVRDSSQVYLTGEPGTAYAVYFPDHVSVEIELPFADYHVSWLDIDSSRWLKTDMISNASPINIEPPKSGNFVALIKPVDNPGSP